MSTNHELTIELQKSRVAIAEGANRVGKMLDVPARVVRTLREQPRWVYWVGGAALVGVTVLALWPRRREPIAVVGKASMPPTSLSRCASTLNVAADIAKFLMPVVRPALTSLASAAIAKYAGGVGKER